MAWGMVHMRAMLNISDSLTTHFELLKEDSVVVQILQWTVLPETQVFGDVTSCRLLNC